MGNPLSNPTPSSSKSAYPGSVGTSRKVGGSKTRHDGSRMNHSGPGVAGSKGGLPLGQQPSPGRQGLPATGYRDHSGNIKPFAGGGAATGGENSEPS